MAKGRRQWGRMEEMMAKKEREATMTGREVVRRGDSSGWARETERESETDETQLFE